MSLGYFISLLPVVFHGVRNFYPRNRYIIFSNDMKKMIHKSSLTINSRDCSLANLSLAKFSYSCNGYTKHFEFRFLNTIYKWNEHTPFKKIWQLKVESRYDQELKSQMLRKSARICRYIMFKISNNGSKYLESNICINNNQFLHISNTISYLD